MRRALIALLLVVGMLLPAMPQAAVVGQGAETWNLTVTATKTGAITAATATAGVDPTADIQHDALDADEPPPSPVPNMRAYFPHDAASPEPWPEDTTFSQDIRPATVVLAWYFEVASSATGSVDLTWDISAVPAGRLPQLKDAAGAVLVPDMRNATTFQFNQQFGFVPKGFILDASENQAPTVTVTSPNGGEKIKGTVDVTADASDADGSVASVLFEYSSNNGVSWTAIGAADTTAPYSASWDTSALPDGDQYLVRATATDDKGATTTDVSNATFVVDNSAPGAPTLLAPADAARTNDTTPDLDWSDVADDSGVTYTVQVDNNADFASPEVTQAGVAVSNFTVGAPLAEGTYNWRVKSVNGVALESAFTAARTFSMDTTAPAAPDLVTPPDAEFVTSNTPALDWSDVTDPSGVTYDVEVDNNADFSSPEDSATGLAVSNHTVAAALANGTYNWRARAVDGAGNTGNYSAVRTFSVLLGVVVWSADLNAAHATNGAAAQGTAGVAFDASDQKDGYDAAEPPPAPAPNMRLYFPHPEDLADPTYGQDIRPVTDILTWPFEVASSATGSVTLTWDVSAVPAKYIAVMLKDGDGTTLVGDLRAAANHQFTVTAAFVPQEFQLFIATDQLPVVTVTDPNGGQNIKGIFVVKATATDPDGTVAQVFFEYSDDGGATWNAIVPANATSNPDTTPAGGGDQFSVDWDTTGLTNGANYLVRATATDDLGASASDISDAVFTVDSETPGTPTLVAPADGAKTSDDTPTFDWWVVDAGPSGVTYDLMVDNNADFSSPEINATGLAASAFTPAAALADGTYSWKVRGVSGAGTPGAFSAVFTVTVDATAPGAPTLVAPADGVFTNVTTPVLDWTDVVDASGVTYTVEVDNNADFSSPETTQALLTVSQFTPGAALAEGLYNWRVQATNGAGLIGPFSVVRTFTVDTTAPGNPGLVAPADGAVTNATPALDWSDVADPAGVTYDVQADNNADFSSPEVDQTGLAASTFTTAALADGTYNWRARAVDGAGNAGMFFTPATFRVDTTAPAAPTLLTPVNGAVMANLRPVFTWQAVTDPSGVEYEFQMAADQSFASLITTQTQTTTTVTLNADLPIGQFFWRVRANETLSSTPGDPGGLAGAYSTASFTIFVPVQQPAPPPPVVIPIDQLTAAQAAQRLAALSAAEAAQTLAGMEVAKAAAAVAEMETSKAAAAIARTAVDKATPILAAMAEEKAVAVMKAVTPQQAAAIMGDLDAAKLTALVGGMTTGEATEILGRMSMDDIAKLSAADLAKAAPNLPFKQTVVEKAPAAAAGLADPTATSTSATETRFVAARTVAGDWATLATTHGAVTKLMARAATGLTNVETTITTLAAKPAAITANLPTGLVINSYFQVTTSLNPADVAGAWLEFKLDKKWINDNNINPWSVTLNRYDGGAGAWMRLPTKRVSDDTTSVTFTATLPGTSVFAIAGSTTLPASTFKVANLSIPAGVETGKAATISVDVTNSSTSAALYVSELWINGALEDVTSASIAAGATSKVSFSVTRASAGTYDVRVDSLTGKLTVAAPPPPPPPPPPAKLGVTALSVTPGQVSPDQEVTVTATVENTGGQSGSLEVQLKVNGVVVESKTVNVAAGKSGQATFTLQESAAGTYAIDVAGKTGTVKVLSPAAFSVSGLSVEPAKVKTGEAVTATARVTNTGELAGSYSASLKVDGATRETRSVPLNPGASATVSFSVPTDVAGTYTVDIGGQTATIEVTRGFNVWVVIGPILGVIVVALAVFMIMRRKPRRPEPKPVA